jgi:hypothetical protein
VDRSAEYGQCSSILEAPRFELPNLSGCIACELAALRNPKPSRTIISPSREKGCRKNRHHLTLRTPIDFGNNQEKSTASDPVGTWAWCRGSARGECVRSVQQHIRIPVGSSSGRELAYPGLASGLQRRMSSALLIHVNSSALFAAPKKPCSTTGHLLCHFVDVAASMCYLEFIK